METSLSYPWNIIGHARSCQHLEDDLLQKNIAHAYLFTGPKSIGKSVVAKRFASFLQCTNQGCGNCHDCLQMDKKIHPDVCWVSEEKDHVSIEDIRYFQELLSKKSIASWRILIFPDLERLSFPAQNAFLKFLEEPPEKTIFLLTSSRPGLLLETVLSRVRTLSFQTPTLTEEITAQLAPPLSVTERQKIQFFSQERIGRFIQLLGNPEQLALYEKFLFHIEECCEHPQKIRRFAIAEFLHEHPDQIVVFLEILQFYLRASRRELPEYQKYLKPSYLEPQVKLRLLEQIEEVLHSLERNINKRLLIENFLLSF